MNYNKINNLTGWGAFSISMIVFLMTMAPTAPFWDCGEFLACMNELEVPHPPGAPFYLILGRVFVMFAGSDTESIAWWGNFMSVVCSAFTVLFVFWTITILARKILVPSGSEPDRNSTLAIMLAGMVGALACAFSDSFWFNAVEAEVYAMSSFFTAIVVWLMFKWDVHADEPHNLRYIVLIAFVMGVSTGAHLLNLLTIPALGMIYYFRKYKPSWPGFLAAFGVSIIILAIVQFGIMQLSVETALKFELQFTGIENAADPTQTSGMGMAPGTGLLIFGLLLVGGLAAGIWYTQKRKMPLWNTALLSVAMIYIGYGTYAMIPIRANADPPINENKPASAVSFLKYLRREQYGDRPLVFGPRYNEYPDSLSSGDYNYVDLEEGVPYSNAKVDLADGTSLTVEKNGVVKNFKAPGKAVDGSWTLEAADGSKVRIDEGTKRAYRISGRYLWDGKKMEYAYGSAKKVFFPRMHSLDGNHYTTTPWGYRNFVSDHGADENAPYDDNPTSSEDIKFFAQYQVAHMYLRYFMWNFVGRGGDEQDLGWESGLAFWKTSQMPDHIRNQQGRNHYYFLPLLLGLFGMVFQFSVRKFDASSTLALFFFTGFAIILYLNQTPLQPRERDYSYVGSFQTFCIWIGLGVIGLYESFKSILKRNTSWITGLVSLLLVPAIMLKANWDDHTRHLNYVAPDSARNLLESCEKNAILFTNGDNDTFPLWYAQEVEGIRPDVRIINLSLLNTDWYIYQLKKKINDAPPVKFYSDQFFYSGDKNQQIDWKPGSVVAFKVDSEKVLANGTVRPELKDSIRDRMLFTPRHRGPKNNPYLLKQDYMILDIMRANAEAGWERPIYFASTIPTQAFIGLDQQGHFQAEGLAFRVVPVKQKGEGQPFIGAINKERSYEVILKKFVFRELNNPDVYVDDHVRSTILGNARMNIYRTGQAFVRDAIGLMNENLMLQNAIRQDSMANRPGFDTRADSARGIIAGNEAKIKEYNAKAKTMFDVITEKLPVEIIPSDPILGYMIGGGYANIKENQLAARYYDHFRKIASETIDYEGFDQSKNDHLRMVSAMDELAEAYAKIGEYEKAAVTAEWLFKIIGDEKYSKDAQGYRARIGKENPLPVK